MSSKEAEAPDDWDLRVLRIAVVGSLVYVALWVVGLGLTLFYALVTT